MLRDILDYQGDVIGQLELPENTTEEVWTQKLSQLALPPVSVDALKISIKERREYCEGLIERFKYRNISQGINALQAMHMHHRMRSLDVTFYGVPMTLDILNMVISGDIEVACLALQNSTPEDMSQPYHWLSADRTNWLIAEMKSYLGWA